MKLMWHAGLLLAMITTITHILIWHSKMTLNWKVIAFYSTVSAQQKLPAKMMLSVSFGNWLGGLPNSSSASHVPKKIAPKPQKASHTGRKMRHSLLLRFQWTCMYCIQRNRKNAGLELNFVHLFYIFCLVEVICSFARFDNDFITNNKCRQVDIILINYDTFISQSK